MTKRQKRRKETRAKYYYILAPLFILLVLITVSELYHPAETKPSCEEYLKIQHTRSLAKTYAKDNQTILIKTLGIKITAIKDAHNIIIDADSPLGPIIIQEMHAGENRDLSIEQITISADLDEEKGVYLIPLNVGCDEAKLETIIIEANPKDIIIFYSNYP